MQTKLQEHKAVVAEGQQLMRDFSRNTDDEIRVNCVDLQQIQPIHRLSTGVACYKRNMWLYSLCFHDLKKIKFMFYVWDEVTAARGSVEIATCLRKWIGREYEAEEFGKLVVFSDNCGGQNKNIKLI